MMTLETLNHFLSTTLETLGSIRGLTNDGKFHAFEGSNSATTGYYRVTTDFKESSFTIDYFHGGFEGSASVTFSIDSMEAPECH